MMSLFTDFNEPDIKISESDKKHEWEEEWKDMPEFIQEKQDPYAKIIIRFDNDDDLQEFANLIGQKLNKKTKSIWFPYKSHWGAIKKEYRDER